MKGASTKITSITSLLLIAVAMFFSGCAFNGALRHEFHTPPDSATKIPLHVAIVKDASTAVAKAQWPVGLGGEGAIALNPGLINATKAELSSIFQKVSVVEMDGYQPGPETPDFFVYPDYVTSLVGSGGGPGAGLTVKAALSFKDPSMKDGFPLYETVYRYDSSEERFLNRMSIGIPMALLMGFSLFTLTPVTLPLHSYLDGTYMQERIEAAISRQLADIRSHIVSHHSRMVAHVQDRKDQGAEQLAGRPASVATAKAIRSDVDDLPIVKAKPNKNAYAIVVGIENYRQKLPKADFATHDARTVAEYLTKVMGYPEENVVTLLNEQATNVDLTKYFEKWLRNNVEEDSSVFIYYSGHGAPNVKTGDAFLVPYDGDPAFIDETGYSIKRLYKAMERLKAKEIVVALDSCFSGAGGKSVIAKGARPLVMKLEQEIRPLKNMAVISASSGGEISSTYEEKGHGLFTYYLLKGLKGEANAKGDGKIEVGQLYEYLRPLVSRTARKVYNNDQSPQFLAPEERPEIFLRR